MYPVSVFVLSKPNIAMTSFNKHALW